VFSTTFIYLFIYLLPGEFVGVAEHSCDLIEPEGLQLVQIAALATLGST